MFYANYNLTIADPSSLEEVVKHCPYGILHCKSHENGAKLAVLVKVFYSRMNGLTFRVAHSYKAMIGELCSDQVSLKLCNRDKNIYVVADVRITPVSKAGYLRKASLNAIVTRLNIFKKNKSDQFVALDRAC